MKRLLALLACLLCLPAAARPNIVTVFIDDMGYSDLSCFGGKRATTEHIDRLAAEGLRFTQFYVNSPICSPSRVALSTGQYPHRWEITSYLANRKLNENRGMAQWLDPAAPMLARQLSAAGYATGHFGKWHMGGQRDVGDAPLITRYGFDASLTNFEGLGPRVLPLCDAFDGKPTRRHDLGSASLGHGPIRWEDRSVVTAAFVEDALDFIDEAAAEKRPFFVNLWPDDVHSPFFPPEVLRDETDGSKRALYYAVLEAMDEQLAPLFDRIRDDASLRENTLIVLCSDNGHEPGAGSSDPLRGAKTWLYEGGIRSPLIVWGPGLIDQDAVGTVNTESVFAAIDLNRSLHEIASVEPAAKLDGENLAATLLGKAKASREAPLFWRRPPDRPGENGEDNPDLAMRDGRWKLLVNYDGSSSQLYDLEADPTESKNLADSKPELVAEMQSELEAWNASMPQDAGDPEFSAVKPLPADRFVNPIGEGADPWIVRDPNADRYLWCLSEGNRAIAIHTSDTLTSLGEKHIVWTAPDTGPTSRQVWAPELHWLEDRWHIYFAPSDGENRNHRAYVLRSKTADPLGEYELHGPLATGKGADGRSPNIWAIDMTPLEHEGRLYALWSGWDEPDSDRQFTYIAPMKSAVELAGPRVLLCANDEHPWEFTENGGKGRGLHEGPQVLKHRGRTFVAYSTGASWLPTYKLGLLELTGADPLDPASWKKYPKPVFRSTEGTYGVGHSSFVRSPDGSEWWHVFHAKRDRDPGWRRAIFAQPMRFTNDGLPDFGKPVAAGQPLPLPSGTRLPTLELPFSVSLKSTTAPEDWSYYGHHQLIDFQNEGLHLGVVPEDPINTYRAGEKLVLDARPSVDLTATVTIDFRGDAQARDAGLLFRTTAPAVGYDAHRGYFAGLIPRTGLLVVGRMDGDSWTELKRARLEIDTTRPHRLQVTCEGPAFRVQVNGEEVLEFKDKTFGEGSVGLRVVDTHAVFSDFEIE